GGTMLFGMPHDGEYNLGPVDWAETQWHNACSTYTQMIEQTESSGELLAGLGSDWAQAGGTCDACIKVTTPAGKSLVLRVVTYGTENAPNNIDVSPEAYNALFHGEYPRSMTWQLTDCGGNGNILYQFQTGANTYWTSLWV